jgi:membrane-bound ClpP family serine protease
LAGVALMLIAVIMAMVDIYPSAPGLSPSLRFQVPVQAIIVNLSVTLLGSILAAWLLSGLLPKTPLYGALISRTVSGESSVATSEKEQRLQLGELGVALSMLRPGGKAQFGDQILDVLTQGEMIPKDARVRIIGHSGPEAIVEAVE